MGDNFWKEWVEADELERIKIIKTLTPFTRGGLCRHMSATLMNSYLRDLYDYMKRHPNE